MNKNIMSTLPVRAIAVLLPVSVLALSACGGGSESGASGPEDVQPVQITSADQLDNPLKDYQPAMADIKMVGAATEELTKRCMEKYGVSDYAATDFGLFEDNFLDKMYAARYGLIDREQAQKSGYTPADLDQASQDAAASAAMPSERQMEVLTGNAMDGTPSKITAADGTPLPEGGCGSAAANEFNLPEDVLGSIDADALSSTAADPRAVAAQQAWSQCMKQAGYDFATREDAAMQMVSSTAPMDEQIRQAVADVDCAISTNYVGIWNAIDAAYQRKLIAEREGDLRANADAIKEMVAKATQIVQGNQ